MRLPGIALLAARIAYAQDVTELERRSQNPVADLVSVPFDFEVDNGGALREQSAIDLDVKPVVPIHLSPRWHLISRTIIPFLSMPTASGARDTGLGNIDQQLFVTPVADEGFIWGAGPMLSFPTATIASIANGRWAAGPAAVALWIGGPWVVGTLATATWTFAQSGSAPALGSVLIQPLVNVDIGAGWAIVSSPMITAEWSDGATQWTVPVGAGVSWTTHIATQALTLGIEYYRDVVHPDDAASNQLQFDIAFLFPSATE